MADIRVNQLPDIAAIAAGDILHILDISSTDDVDSQTTVDAIADWIIANKSVRITGIDDVPGLRAALDGKADIVHTHTVGQVIGLQADLDNKTDLSQAQIIGRNVILNGNSINVPSTIGGLQDDRIPDTVVIGDYLQFGTTGGGINNITGDDLKGSLNINLVDNTSDIAKPVSTLQQTALDTKVNTSTYTTGQSEQDTRILSNTNAIAATALDILLNTQKRSYPAADETKLAGIETGADVTDTTNVWSSLGISTFGSTGQVLSQRGVFVDVGSGGGGVTDYDDLTDKPIDRLGPLQTISFLGTRTNVEAPNPATNEFSTITMQNSFNPVPTQYTSIFTSPNTSFTPALVLPTGSQGRQLSLTETDGTVHRFAYTTNGNYRLLDGGLTGTVRLGAVAVATTASVTAAVSVPDQTAGQTITLTGDQTGVFSVGDFISPLNNNFGAYRGIFIETITLNGGNTDIVGTSNGAATFNTTSTLYLAGPADTIQGTTSSFSYDPDTADAVYSSSITSEAFTNTGAGITGHITQVANSITSLETDITWDGVITTNSSTSQISDAHSVYLGQDGSGGSTTWTFSTSSDGLTGRLQTAVDADWTVLNGLYFGFDVRTTTSIWDSVEVGDSVNITLGAGSATFPITSKQSGTDYATLGLGVASDVVGTIGVALTVVQALALDVQAILNTSSITLDLGTSTNIDSMFSITGGLNNLESVVNTDAAPGVGNSAASTITLTDPTGTNILSFTAGVALATDANTALIAQTIADYINDNPTGYTANPLSLSDGSVVMNILGDRAVITEPWNVTIDNNGVIPANAGNIVIDNGDIGLGNVVNETELLTISENGYIRFGDGTEQNTAAVPTTVTKADVDTAIESGTLDTDYYASDKTWKTIPSGGGSSETGTWTPVFNSGGTQGTVTARYVRVGDNVTLTVQAEVGVSTATSFYSVTVASLPFAPATTDLSPTGTYLIGSDFAGVAALTTAGIIFFKTDRSIIVGTDVSGVTAFTITYETT